MTTTTIAKLRIGQRFSWIPAAWYGPCRLSTKTKRVETVLTAGNKFEKVVKYDLKYDAAVVNPPGVTYGVPANTRVRLLKPKRTK
jgi:hypothetical protein